MRNNVTNQIDIALILGPDNIYDIGFDPSGDFTTTQGFDTSLNMSFYVESRADASEQSDPIRRSGWVGNEVNNIPNFEIGSKNWLLYQTKKTLETLNFSQTYNYNAFQWLVTGGFCDAVNVNSEFTYNGIAVNIDLIVNNKATQSFEYILWQNTPSLSS